MLEGVEHSFSVDSPPVIAPERAKKWLDCQQVDEIRLVIDRFIETLECQIEILQSDRSQSFCQGSDVLARCDSTKLFNAFLGLRPRTSVRSEVRSGRGEDQSGNCLNAALPVLRDSRIAVPNGVSCVLPTKKPQYQRKYRNMDLNGYVLAMAELKLLRLLLDAG
jgi:hypothetical protein